MSFLAPVPASVRFICKWYEDDVTKQNECWFSSRNEDKSVCFKRTKGSVAGSLVEVLLSQRLMRLLLISCP